MFRGDFLGTTGSSTRRNQNTSLLRDPTNSLLQAKPGFGLNQVEKNQACLN